MKIYNEMTYEEIGDILYENIDDAYTRNLALHILEDREDARCNCLGFEEENTNLRQALNEIREYISKHKSLSQAEELDYYVISNYILQIIDKALGGNNE